MLLFTFGIAMPYWIYQSVCVMFKWCCLSLTTHTVNDDIDMRAFCTYNEETGDVETRLQAAAPTFGEFVGKGDNLGSYHPCLS